MVASFPISKSLSKFSIFYHTSVLRIFNSGLLQPFVKSIMPAYRSALLFGLVFTFCQWLIIAGLLLAVVFSFGYGENDYASMNVEFSIVLYLGFSQIYEKLPMRLWLITKGKISFRHFWRGRFL